MTSIPESTENQVLNVKEGDFSVDLNSQSTLNTNQESSISCASIPFVKKLIAEFLDTYFLIFAGCASEIVDHKYKAVTLPGISIVWGLVLMCMIYSVNHISGSHLNPAVTIAFAATKRFTYKQVPAYVGAQLLGATLASGTLRLIFYGNEDHFAGTLPSGSELQSFAVEFITTFYRMFVVCGVATDKRAFREFAGLAIGSIVLINVMFARPISGGSMNPVRSLGPAIVWREYRGIWVYLVGPTLGAVCAAWVYKIFTPTDKPLP
ncbi:hypothetical protein UlMin_018700 [Ulmus minor]